ncbi:MAG: hypothetical protein BIFFINMI_02550 [Phycisphaerae bacterium]|nr:hypothetical protein [Phycisphaerae bacterium]
MSDCRDTSDAAAPTLHISGGFELRVWAEGESIFDPVAGLRLSEDAVCFLTRLPLETGAQAMLQLHLPPVERGRIGVDLELSAVLESVSQIEDGRRLCAGGLIGMTDGVRAVLADFIAAQIGQISRAMGQFDPFEAFGPGELIELAQSVTPMRLARHQRLYREGDEEPELAGVYVIRRGTVKVYKGDDATDPLHVLAVLGPGEIFSEMSLIQPGPHQATIEALVPADLMLIHALGYDAMKRRHPATAVKFLEMIARVLVRRLSRTTAKLFSSVRA